MSRDAFVIKGTRRGLSLTIAEDVEISEVIDQLRGKLESAQDFFGGAAVHIQPTERELSPEERAAIQRTIEDFGMLLEEDTAPPFNSDVRDADTQKRDSAIGDDAILIRRTLRSGQTIEHDNSVVIMGDVNAGAEVISSGDIIVLGSLRGMAHAGCSGNAEAVVLAFRLQPTQLRVANVITRAPDGGVPRPKGPEIARVKNNTIHISAYGR